MHSPNYEVQSAGGMPLIFWRWRHWEDFSFICDGFTVHFLVSDHCGNFKIIQEHAYSGESTPNEKLDCPCVIRWHPSRDGTLGVSHLCLRWHPMPAKIKATCVPSRWNTTQQDDWCHRQDRKLYKKTFGYGMGCHLMISRHICHLKWFQVTTKHHWGAISGVHKTLLGCHWRIPLENTTLVFTRYVSCFASDLVSTWQESKNKALTVAAAWAWYSDSIFCNLWFVSSRSSWMFLVCVFCNSNFSCSKSATASWNWKKMSIK